MIVGPYRESEPPLQWIAYCTADHKGGIRCNSEGDAQAWVIEHQSELHANDASVSAADERIVRDFPDVFPATTIGGYFVQSESREGVWWLVTVAAGVGLVCQCPGAQSRTLPGESAKCRHAKRLMAWTAATEAAKARPVAAPNVSALVD